ncbi:DUF6538 domain-containing protein [Ferrovibrio xuzhouensis]|uniref:DUF6538 domain-containing protein n=1 Tax=Ferrovibrio xuzhouensis TaxID=1576914 RepID=A0ABV7VL32_9PROT
MKYIGTNKNGNLTYRRELPEHLQRALGRKNFIRSFGTQDAAEALPRYNEYHQWVEEQIAAVSTGAQIVSVEEAKAIAERWYLEASKADRAKRHIADYPDDGRATPDDELGGFSIYSTSASVISTELEMGNLAVVEKETDEALRIAGVVVSRESNSWLRVSAAVGAKVVRHLLRQEARGGGDWSEADKPVRSIGVSLTELKDRWARTQPNKKTVGEATKTVGEFIALAGPVSADKITTKNVADYRDDRLAKGNKPQTVTKKVGFPISLLKEALDRITYKEVDLGGVSWRM